MKDISTDSSSISKPTLSQASAKRKLLIALPLTLIGAVMWSADVAGGMTLCILFGAYALVGAIKLVGGNSLGDAAKNWDALPGWKKGLISAIVIAAAIAILILVIVIYARPSELT